MKPALLLITMFLILLVLQGSMQSQTITFSGKDANSGSIVNIDSIRVLDITLQRDTVLKGVTSFDLSAFTTSVMGSGNDESFGAEVSNNVINSINHIVRININIPNEGILDVEVFNSLAQSVASHRRNVMPGSHQLNFEATDLASGVYFVRISDGRNSKCHKIISLLSGASQSGRLSYQSYNPPVKSTFGYNTGDTYNFIGYADGYNPSQIKEQNPNGGENYEFSFKSKTNNILSKLSLIPVLYQHIKDSGGGTTRSGSELVLMFTPYDSVYLYIGSDTDAVSFHGRYYVQSNKVRILITDPDFPLDVEFAVDTSEAEITIPVQIFSDQAGTSRWKKTRPTLEAAMITLFNATALSEPLPPKAIQDRVKDYGNCVKDNDPESNVKNISTDGTDIVVEQYEGMTIWVIMYVYRFPATKVTLNPGQLASDPRTHLNVISPKIDTFDPPEKTALSIAPWDTKSFPNWTTDASGNLVCDYTKMASTFGAHDSLDRMDRILTAHGYKCKTLKNEDAKIENIIKELLPGDGRTNSPGLVYFSTHGIENGNLQTGTFWTTTEENNAWITSIKTKYPDLWLFESTAAEGTKVFAQSSLNYGFRPGKTTNKILLRPLFWKWLGSKGADFSRSFVHISACLTDSTPELRNYIKARAYLAYRIAVPANFAGAVQWYFINSLIRPTHSAEEAYYNIMRLSASKQMIYKEDTIMISKIPVLPEGKVQTWFKGYGWDGSEMVPYQEAGWFKSEKIDQGSQWWLLWASRWGQDAQKGWQAIKDCWNNCWQYGDMGGLANPGCNSMTPGRVPTPEETAYTGWLLKGEMTISPPGSIKKVPRFTLFDGK